MLSNFLMEIVSGDRSGVPWKQLAQAAAQSSPRSGISPKIEAIKALREAHGLSLKEAKDTVEYYMANFQNIKESDLVTYQIEYKGATIEVTQTGADQWSVRRVENLGTFTHQGLMNVLIGIGAEYGP